MRTRLQCRFRIIYILLCLQFPSGRISVRRPHASIHLANIMFPIISNFVSNIVRVMRPRGLFVERPLVFRFSGHFFFIFVAFKSGKPLFLIFNLFRKRINLLLQGRITRFRFCFASSKFHQFRTLIFRNAASHPHGVNFVEHIIEFKIASVYHSFDNRIHFYSLSSCHPDG